VLLMQMSNAVIWDHIITALIASIPGTLVGLATLIATLRTHGAVNGIVGERVRAAKAEGAQEERNK